MKTGQVLVRLALRAILIAHKRHIVHKSMNFTHLVLAVAITSCRPTCHLFFCLQKMHFLRTVCVYVLKKEALIRRKCSDLESYSLRLSVDFQAANFTLDRFRMQP